MTRQAVFRKVPLPFHRVPRRLAERKVPLPFPSPLSTLMPEKVPLLLTDSILKQCCA